MDERITKYFMNELSREERISLLEESMEDPDLREEIQTYQKLRSFLWLATENIDPESGKASLARMKNRKRRKRNRQIVWISIGYAASLLLVCMLSYLFINDPDYNKSLQANQQELYVPPGQRARITLPDGSIAWLNAGSTLSYPSHFFKSRKVTLRGEGYFEVKKSNKHPFIVHTGDLNIMALGTEFNISGYPGKDISVSLIEGSVKVYRENNEERAILMKPNEQIFYKNGEFLKTEYTDHHALMWKEGIYSFKKASMEQIIAELESYYEVEIKVEDPSILKFEYTGKFRQHDGIMEILRLIQKIHKFKIDKQDELNLITLSL